MSMESDLRRQKSSHYAFISIAGVCKQQTAGQDLMATVGTWESTGKK